MLNLEGYVDAPQASKMATEAEVGEDSCFHVPVLIHPHTEALAALLMPGLSNLREKDTNGAQQLRRQNSLAKDAASRHPQEQTPTQTPVQGDEKSAALGRWVSPPAVASLREQARHLQQQRHAMGRQQMMLDMSLGQFELPRGALQSQSTYREKLPLLDNNRSFTLVGATSSTPVCQGSKELTAAPATSIAAPPHRCDPDGGVVVPIHLMASLLIKDNFKELSSQAQRRAGVGFGGAGSDGNDGTGVDEAMQTTAAWQSPTYGEIPSNEDDGAVLDAIPEMRDAAQDVHPVQTGTVGDPGASGTAGTRTAVVAGDHIDPRWPAPSVPSILPDLPLLHDMGFKAAAGGKDDCGGIQWRSSASQQLQQGQQALRQSPQPMLDACCPSGSQPPLSSETSEEGFEQQRHMPSPAGFHTGVAASPHGPRWLSFTLQQRSEEKDGREADGAMLIDTTAAQGVPDGALLPTPERPRAPNAIGSWDALRGIRTFSTESPDTDGRAGVRGAQGQGDGVLGTLALLSPGLREDSAVGSDAAMADPLAGSEPGRGRVGEVGNDLETSEQGKELLKPGTGVAPAVELLEGEDGFDADDEGESLAGTREERGARAAFKLFTGHSVRWRPLPGLEASPPWSSQRASSTAASHHSAALSPQRHGFPSFASLALALPPSTHMPPRNTWQPSLGQEPTSSRPPIPRTVAPAVPTQAAAATGVASFGGVAAAAAGVRQVVSPENMPGHCNAADGEAERESLEEVLKLKCSLRRAVQSQNPQAMGLVLSLLAALPFTPQMLADSQVTALVSPLQFNSSTEVANAARHLIAGWKEVLKAASRRSLDAQILTHLQTQQQQQLGRNHQLEWPQSPGPLRGSLRMIADHVTTVGAEDVNHCNHQPDHSQHQQQMDVHIRDQAGRPRVRLNSTQEQPRWHPHHYPRATALGEERLPAPHDLSLQSLSLGRCRSDMQTKSVATGGAANARAGSAPDSVPVSVAAAAAVSDATDARHPSSAAQTKLDAGGVPTQAYQRSHPAGLRVRVQMAPLRSPQALHVSPGAEAPVGTLGTDQAGQEGDATQLSRRMPLAVVALGKSALPESPTVSETEAEACSSGEDRQHGGRSCPGGWDILRAGAASADIADPRDARLGHTMSIDAALMDCMPPSCSPLSMPSAVAVAAPGGSRGSDGVPHSRPYPFVRSAVVPGDVTAGHIPLGSLSLGAGAAHSTPTVSISRRGQDATCPQGAVASPTSGMTQPTPPTPHCIISPPAALPLTAAGMINGGRSATVRLLPPPSTVGQTTGRKRKIERPASRRRSGNPCKRPASSTKMGQLGPGDPPGSIYPGGLSRAALYNTAIGTSADTASDAQRYLLPAGGLVAGAKTPARSSLLGLHPPPSKRQRHHSGFGSGASPASHANGGAAQVRRVSILLSSLDLGSAGNGVEDEATEASGETDATGVGAAAVVAARDLDADADMGSQDDEARMLTSGEDLLPAIEPCGGAVDCPRLGEKQEVGPTESKGKDALAGGETSLPSMDLMSGPVMGIGNGTNGLHQAAGPGDIGAAVPAGGCAGAQAVVGDGCSSETEPEAAGLPVLPSSSSLGPLG
ncbi:hypothetical protein VaNZ11_007379 [Volvox africanus]|uniref:TFIIS N-terminal domain-containing protein n=1 Tax=Volvox africanus TaxID=51714 RepID=A0ABQ5S2Q7_9CHLO|nr:hypothetical protein VaNZ11_007379 [Volvox africanus]